LISIQDIMRRRAAVRPPDVSAIATQETPPLDPPGQPGEDALKLMRYSRKTEPAALARLGVLVGNDLVADLRAGHALFLAEEKGNPKGEELAAIFMPPYLTQFLHLGESGWEALAETHAWLAEIARPGADAVGLRGEKIFIPFAECRLYAPVRPSKLITIGGNYPRPGADAREGLLPSCSLKVASALIGPGRDILKPAAVHELDCEAELAVVIGTKCKHVPESKVHEVIAGYTILNDVTARDLAGRELEGGRALLGKCLDTFAPLGPWMVTRDEIPDPMNLRIRLRVNGETRREGSTSDMLDAIARLVSHVSAMTLMPGDVIATGSPVPASSQALKPLVAGDVVEAEVEKIGVLMNAIVDEPR